MFDEYFKNASSKHTKKKKITCAKALQLVGSFTLTTTAFLLSFGAMITDIGEFKPWFKDLSYEGLLTGLILGPFTGLGEAICHFATSNTLDPNDHHDSHQENNEDESSSHPTAALSRMQIAMIIFGCLSHTIEAANNPIVILYYTGLLKELHSAIKVLVYGGAVGWGFFTNAWQDMRNNVGAFRKQNAESTGLLSVNPTNHRV